MTGQTRDASMVSFADSASGARHVTPKRDWSNLRASESRDLVTADDGLLTGGRKALREGKLSKKPLCCTQTSKAG